MTDRVPIADPAALLPPQLIGIPRASDSLAATLRAAFSSNDILSEDFLGLLARIDRSEQRATQHSGALTPGRAPD